MTVFWILGSALFSSRRLTISAFPLKLATWSGVSPSSCWMFGSAPNFIRVCIRSGRFESTAVCRAVSPVLVFRLGSAPDRSKYSVMFRWPHMTDLCRGVQASFWIDLLTSFGAASRDLIKRFMSPMRQARCIVSDNSSIIKCKLEFCGCWID